MIGDQKLEKDLGEKDETLSFKVKLFSGQAKVSAWFERDGKNLRSYSLEVEKVKQNITL